MTKTSEMYDFVINAMGFFSNNPNIPVLKDQETFKGKVHGCKLVAFTHVDLM